MKNFALGTMSVATAVGIADSTASGASEATIYKILIGIAIFGLITAASRAKSIATWISGWKK